MKSTLKIEILSEYENTRKKRKKKSQKRRQTQANNVNKQLTKEVDMALKYSKRCLTS